LRGYAAAPFVRPGIARSGRTIPGLPNGFAAPTIPNAHSPPPPEARTS